MIEITLKVGDLAYFDSLFSGLVPIKILKIEVVPFQLRYLVKSTCRRGAYPKGEYFTLNKGAIIPRNTVKVRNGKYYIKPHQLTIVDLNQED